MNGGAIASLAAIILSGAAMFAMPKWLARRKRAEEVSGLLVAHSTPEMKCLDCWEHGAPFDGPCDSCGYTRPGTHPAAVRNFNEQMRARQALGGDHGR